MNFRMAKMDDLPQLKVVYKKIIEEMNYNNILMSRLFWTIVPIFLCTIVQLFLSDILDNAVAVL